MKRLKDVIAEDLVYHRQQQAKADQDRIAAPYGSASYDQAMWSLNYHMGAGAALESIQKEMDVRARVTKRIRDMRRTLRLLQTSGHESGSG